MNNQDFGKFINSLRKEKHLTQKELAERLGVTDKAVSCWENGKNYPDIEILEILGKELDVSISELIACKKIENVEEAEIETAKVLITERNRAINFKKYALTITALFAVVVLLLITPTSFIATETEYGKTESKELQALTYRVVKWSKPLDDGSTYRHTSWYFFADSKKSTNELWRKENFELLCQDRSTNDIQVGTMNIGAEMPNILYMDYQIVVFFGTCGLIVYDYQDDIIKSRVSINLIKDLGFIGVYPIIDSENKRVYFPEGPDVDNRTTTLVYSIDSRILSKVEEIPRFSSNSDVRISELDEKTRIEYEIKNKYLTSWDCYNDGGMKAFLIADNNWDMKSLKLVIDVDGKKTEYKIFK